MCADQLDTTFWNTLLTVTTKLNLLRPKVNFVFVSRSLLHLIVQISQIILLKKYSLSHFHQFSLCPLYFDNGSVICI